MPNSFIKTKSCELPHKFLGVMAIIFGIVFSSFSQTVEEYNACNTGMPSGKYYATTTDLQGDLWIASAKCGIIRFNGINWTVLQAAENALNGAIPTSIEVDGMNHKWIGSIGSGLIYHDGSNWIAFNTLNSGLSSNNVNCITLDHQGNKWITTVLTLKKLVL